MPAVIEKLPLNQISRELLHEQNSQLLVTSESVDLSLQNLDIEVNHLLDQRSNLLESLKSNNPGSNLVCVRHQEGRFQVGRL